MNFTNKFSEHRCPSIVNLIQLYCSLAYNINFTINGHIIQYNQVKLMIDRYRYP